MHVDSQAILIYQNPSGIMVIKELALKKGIKYFPSLLICFSSGRLKLFMLYLIQLQTGISYSYGFLAPLFKLM